MKLTGDAWYSEPEAADPGPITAAADQRRRDALRANARRLDALTPEQRIRLLKAAARDSRADISSELRLIRHLAAQGRTTSLTRQLAKIEARFGLRDQEDQTP